MEDDPEDDGKDDDDEADEAGAEDGLHTHANAAADTPRNSFVGVLKVLSSENILFIF